MPIELPGLQAENVGLLSVTATLEHELALVNEFPVLVVPVMLT